MITAQDITTVVEALLEDELPPKRLLTVASKIGRTLVKQLKDETRAAELAEPVEITPEVALATLQALVDSKPPRARSRRAAKKTPVARAAKKSAKKPAAQAQDKNKKSSRRKKVEPARGKKKLPQEAVEVMAAKKALWWAVYRKEAGQQAKDTDAALIKEWRANDAKLVKEYQIKARASAEKRAAGAGADAQVSKTRKSAGKKVKTTASAAAKASKTNDKSPRRKKAGTPLTAPTEASTRSEPSTPVNGTANGAALSPAQQEALGL